MGAGCQRKSQMLLGALHSFPAQSSCMAPPRVCWGCSGPVGLTLSVEKLLQRVMAPEGLGHRLYVFLALPVERAEWDSREIRKGWRSSTPL